MHDLAYRDAVEAAMLRPLTAEEQLDLATIHWEQRIAPSWDASARRQALARAGDRMITKAVRAIVRARGERAALPHRERVALQDRQAALLLAGIRDTHRVVWSRSHAHSRWEQLLGEVLTARFVPRDEPLGPGEETLG